MNWRPEGHKNPYPNNSDKDINGYFAHEEGFDACLEALKKYANHHFSGYIQKVVADYGFDTENGTWVFIPEGNNACT